MNRLILSKEDILKVNDLKTKKIKVPEWGGDVIISVMTAADRDIFEMSMINADGSVSKESIRARVASLTLVDEQGNRLFTDKDLIALGKKSGTALTRVYDASQKLNRITDEDIEELAKN